MRQRAGAAIRVWINQGFSLHGLIRAIGIARPDIDLCVSATDPRSPVREVAPTFWTEPSSRDIANYAGWLLDTAVARRVDAIMVQRGRQAVSGRIDEFAARGIAVHVCASPQTLALLDDKVAFTADLAGDDRLARTVPVASVDQFVRAVEAIEATGAVACVKPARGIYGAGYWTLTGDDPFAHLSDPDGRRITTAMFAAGLSAREARGEPFSLLVMEHLPGLEASVDIVARQGEVLLAAVRTKLDANRQRIQTRHAVIDHAGMLVGRYALHGAINIQYRLDRHGEWRILEINTRPAGGASYHEAVGIPFAATWIDLAPDRARRFTADVDRQIVALIAPVAAGQAEIVSMPA